MSGKLNKKNNHTTNIYTSSNKKIVIIKHKYRQLTWGFLKTILSKNIRNHTKGSLAKVSSQIKLQTLFQEKPHNRHSPERSRIQSGYLWIDKYTSCNCSSVYKTCTINKNLTDISVTSFLFRIRINLTVANFYTLLVAYSKVRQLYKLSYQCRIFGIWKKSYSTVSKVIPNPNLGGLFRGLF